MSDCDQKVIEYYRKGMKISLCFPESEEGKEAIREEILRIMVQALREQIERERIPLA